MSNLNKNQVSILISNRNMIIDGKCIDSTVSTKEKLETLIKRLSSCNVISSSWWSTCNNEILESHEHLIISIKCEDVIFASLPLREILKLTNKSGMLEYDHNMDIYLISEIYYDQVIRAFERYKFTTTTEWLEEAKYPCLYQKFADGEDIMHCMAEKAPAWLVPKKSTLQSSFADKKLTQFGKSPKPKSRSSMSPIAPARPFGMNFSANYYNGSKDENDTNQKSNSLFGSISSISNDKQEGTLFGKYPASQLFGTGFAPNKNETKPNSNSLFGNIGSISNDEQEGILFGNVAVRNVDKCPPILNRENPSCVVSWPESHDQTKLVGTTLGAQEEGKEEGKEAKNTTPFFSV
jgi:hypothetical protein